MFRLETKIIAKVALITKVPGKFQDYETSEEEPVEQPRRHDLYGFVDHPQLQQGYPMNEFAPHRLPQPKGNMNGWLIEDEEEVERNEVDSDLESTAIRDHDRNEYDGKGGAIALTRWIEKIENVIDNSGCAENQKVRRYIAGLAPEIRGMLRATQPTTIQNAILRAGILTDGGSRCGTLTKGRKKQKGMEESMQDK
ncbi:hypothetical protein Tco_1399802 [Tanacetum coccineum]